MSTDTIFSSTTSSLALPLETKRQLMTPHARQFTASVHRGLSGLIRPKDTNLSIDPRATAVICPSVASDWMTSRKGARKATVSNSCSSCIYVSSSKSLWKERRQSLWNCACCPKLDLCRVSLSVVRRLWISFFTHFAGNFAPAMSCSMLAEPQGASGDPAGAS